jgi:hypothetical protein
MSSFKFVTPGVFHAAISKARRGMGWRKQACLTQYSPSAYAEMRTFLSVGGKSGFAIKPDGELVSVFSALRGQGRALLSEAVAQGARKLDCYDGVLVAVYTTAGFVEVRREPWEGFDLLCMGRPDVVYMEVAAEAAGPIQ